jgi:hypothetical protein
MVSCRHARLSSTGRWVSTDGEVAGVGLEFLVLARDGRSRLPGILPVAENGEALRHTFDTAGDLTPDDGVIGPMAAEIRRRFSWPEHGFVANFGSAGASAVRADRRRTVSDRVRRIHGFRLNHAASVGRGQAACVVRMGLQAGGHRFDPGTLH